MLDLVNLFFCFYFCFFLIDYFIYLGGCTVTLVKKSAVKKCIETIKNGYKGKANFYEFEPCDGARPIDIKKSNEK